MIFILKKNLMILFGKNIEKPNILKKLTVLFSLSIKTAVK